MIIICYDGSEYAQAAADQAIRLFPKTPRRSSPCGGPTSIARTVLALGRALHHRVHPKPRGPD